MATRLVVEWTRTTVRLAVAEGGARARLKGVYSQALGESGDPVPALRGLLKTYHPTPSQVIGVVSREQVLTRVVKFPATEPNELVQMVELYAKAQLPYPREHMVLDFHLLGQEQGFSTVAVVACQREIVDRQLTVLREAGVPVSLLTVSSWGVLHWYRQASRAGSVAEPCLVVNVDEARTDLVLVNAGRILSSRSVNQGAKDWELAGDAAELLAIEVERSRAAIRKELQGTELACVVLTGVGALSAWKDAVSQRTGLSVTLIDWAAPFKGWKGPAPSMMSPVVIAGLAGSDLRGMLNLSPPDVRLQVSHREQVRALALASGLLIGVLALGAGLLGLQASRHQQLAVQLDRALAEIEPTAKRAQEQTRSTQVVSAALEDRRRLARTLADVFGQTPATVTLDGLTFERVKWEITVRGTAESTEDMLGYRKQLEQLDGVSSVDLRYSTRRSTPSGERIDFELILRQRRTAS